MKTPEKFGPYRVEGVLGKGGMGRVYRARHTDTGDPVAIKALSPQLALNDGFIERFRTEIETLRKLRHASIVRLFGYGQEEDTLFYSMELVDGPSLEDELRQGRRFNWREAIDIGVQVCRALKHAHDHGITHRDIKPANILLTPSGKAKLADFGISRLFGGTSLTVPGGVIGTADYMAPEQVAGAGVTPQCDQYCLGGVMYALLAGRPPFVAGSLAEMLQLQQYADPEPLRRFATETPAQLEDAVMQMLSKEPGQRFPNTMVLAKHLEAMRLALSRTPEPDAEAAGDSPDNPAPPSSVTVGPNSVTRGYDSGAEMIGAGADESIVLVDDNEDEDQTPAASAMLTGRDGCSAPTLAVATPADPSADPPPSLFTEVQPETAPKAATGASPWWSLAVQGVLAAGLLATAGWLAYGLLAPPSANALYTTIQQTIEPGDAAAFRSAAADVASFLERFPNDPRADELHGVQQAIDTNRLERQLSTKLLANRLKPGRGTNTAASPLEQLYLAAMERSKTNPDRAVQDLQALAVLLQADGATSGNNDLAALVARQIERLGEAAEQESAAHQPFLKAQLRRARKLSADKPDKAKQICDAVIALYGDRPWAAPLLEEARAITTAPAR